MSTPPFPIQSDTCAAGVKIFVVDDNKDTLHLLACLLEGAGFEVRCTGTMQAALLEFPEFGSQLLLSDIGLPDGDGWELLRQLGQAGLHPYAIAMSGFGTPADHAASARAGFRHHMVKPIDLDALERVLDEARREVAATR